MSDLPDLAPAADRLSALVRAVTDDQLTAPTPCPDYSVRDLLGHVQELSTAFTRAAGKSAQDDSPPGGTVSLAEDWRERIPALLAALAAAWREPSAWQGETEVGGARLPGDLAGTVAVDELVLHGWDLAVATGQPFEVDPASLAVATSFVERTLSPQWTAGREGLFGDVVEMPADASPLERTLGLSGRDPDWRP